MLACFVGVGGNLDAAGLTAATDLDLRLDYAGVANLLGGGHCFIDRSRRNARWNGDFMPCEKLFALIFE